MRKFCTILSLLFSLTVFGQSAVPRVNLEKYRVSNEEVAAAKARLNQAAERTSYSIYVDYPVADQIEAGSPTIQNFLWTFNSGYDANDTDVVAMNYIGVRIRDLIGYTDPTQDPLATYVGPFPYNNSTTITIDSIYALFSHENNSGLPDTFIVELRQQNAGGNLLPSGALVWSDSVITTSTLSPGGNWLGSNALFSLAMPCGITTTPNQRVGVTLQYRAPEADTLGMLAGFVPNPDNTELALKTRFPNSFFRWMGVLSSQVVNSSNIFFPPAPGADTGYFEAQNWQIWALVTFIDETGFKKSMYTNMDMGNSYPNPTLDASRFNFSTAKPQNINLEIFDLNGRVIYTRNLGFRNTGDHLVELPSDQLESGTYFYRLQGEDGASEMKKFTVVR